MSTERTERPAPHVYRFSEEAFDRHSHWFWACPKRLAADGTLSNLWRTGSGAATSVLAVLACHVRPRKEDPPDRPKEPSIGLEWTGWTYLSQRRISCLAGISLGAVRSAIQQLTSLGLVETRRVQRDKHEGGFQLHCRLATILYASEGEPRFSLSASFLYGGTWSLLPTAAARHLYLVLACLDPIGDEQAYLQKIEEEAPGAGESELQELLLEQRQRHPLSLADISTASGLSHTTTIEAIRVLTEPLFGGEVNASGEQVPLLPLIDQGSLGLKRPAWYAPNRRTLRYRFSFDLLNDPNRRKAFRASTWPSMRARPASGERLQPFDFVLARLKTGSVSAWQEAHDLVYVREMEARKLGRSYMTNRQLLDLTGCTLTAISQSTQIVKEITPEILRLAGVGPAAAHRLSRAALYRIATPALPDGRPVPIEWRATALQEEVSRLV